MGEIDLFFKVAEANKGKRLSSRYFHTYNLNYFHIIISDLYDKTQGHVQGVVTLTYLLRS